MNEIEKHINPELKEKIFDDLSNILDENYSYHNLDHTKRVISAAVDIGSNYDLSEKDWRCLLAACLLHDYGFIESHVEHEKISAKLSSQILPKYGFSETDIQIINSLIIVTKLEEKPKNLFLYNGDAREFLEIIGYKVSFVRIHFPDPWPKKKHIKRRLISKNFLHLLDQKISKKGKIEIITDSKIYQDHIEEVLGEQKIFKQIDSFEISYEVSTFHRKGLKKGHEVKRYVLTKI